MENNKEKEKPSENNKNKLKPIENITVLNGKFFRKIKRKKIRTDKSVLIWEMKIIL